MPSSSTMNTLSKSQKGQTGEQTPTKSKWFYRVESSKSSPISNLKRVHYAKVLIIHEKHLRLDFCHINLNSASVTTESCFVHSVRSNDWDEVYSTSRT